MTPVIPPAAVAEWVRVAVLTSGLRILALTKLQLESHLDSGPGVSIVAVLVESHLSVETWPEYGVVCFDLYSCVPVDMEAIRQSFVSYFGVTETTLHRIVERFGVEKR